jgi:hypothetical protein
MSRNPEELKQYVENTSKKSPIIKEDLNNGLDKFLID